MVCTQGAYGGSNMIGKEISYSLAYPICLQVLGGDFEVCEFFHSLLFFRFRKDTTDNTCVSPLVFTGSNLWLGKLLFWMLM